MSGLASLIAMCMCQKAVPHNNDIMALVVILDKTLLSNVAKEVIGIIHVT